MSNNNIYKLLVSLRLAPDSEIVDAGCVPLEPLVFATDTDTLRIALSMLYCTTPMSVEDMAQQKPMSYYIALEQDKQQAKEHGEIAVLTVRKD